VGGLFTGAGPTVVRAMALNMGMLASNDQVRKPKALDAVLRVTQRSSHSLCAMRARQAPSASSVPARQEHLLLSAVPAAPSKKRPRIRPASPFWLISANVQQIQTRNMVLFRN
jgi:hypothetical protein